MIYYIRDDSNHFIGFRYYNRMNEETYYYVKNAQEDIIGILDSDYNKIATYEYDAWGKIVSIKDSNNNEITDSNHIAHINPFRYRSYYYDEETKLYYLNSRYYDPNFGRFINADGVILQTSKDMFSVNLYFYCSNSPINRIDVLGYAWYDGLVNWFQKTVTTVTDTFNFLKKSFVAEAGIGAGIGVSGQIGPAKVQASAYKDFGTGISNGKKYNYSTTSAGLELEATSKKKFGLGAEINHVNDNNFENWKHDNPMAMPWEVWNCTNTTKNLLIGTYSEKMGSIESTNEEIFIGISFEAHLGLGGHFKLGFNIK